MTIQDISRKQGVEVFFKLIMFTAAITGIALIAGFYPVHANIPLIIIPSILVLIYSKPVFFEKMKLTTLLTMRIAVVFAVLGFFNPQFYVDVVMIMLVVNILEATFTDLIRHKKVYNAISGFAVAIGVVVLNGVWLFDAPIGTYYTANGVVPMVTAFYVIAYTIWNWIFVTNEFSDSVSLMHIGFLAAPLIAGLCTIPLGINGGLGIWLLVRANSLATGGWLQIGAKDWFEKEFHHDKFEQFVLWTKKTSVQIVLMIINLILVGSALYITLQNGGVQFGFSPFFL